MKRIIVLMTILSLFLTACGKQNYTENIIRVREKFQPWYLSSKLNGGQVYDRALKNAKWKDEGSRVIVSGKDKKTGNMIVVYYTINENKVDVEKMTVNGEEKTYSDWYHYMIQYID